MKKFLILIACALLLSGCKKSEIIPNEPIDPEFGQSVDDYDPTIIWEQVWDSAQDYFLDKAFFPYAQDISLGVDDKKMDLSIVYAVDDDVKSEDAQKYAKEVLEDFNNIVSEQDFSIEKPSESSYGGIYNKYSVSIGIAPISTKDDPTTWFVNDRLEVGEYREIKLQK